MGEHSSGPWPLQPDPDRDLVLDARSLRAVAHPVRLRLLGLLRMNGPSTATALAAQLGLNSGATSYHLRKLAEGGLIVDVPDRGTGRDRWWRAAHRSTFFQAERLSAADREAGVEYLRAIAMVYAEQMHRAAEERPLLPPEWQAAGMFGDYPLYLTPAEAQQLMLDLREVLSRYRSAPPTPAPTGTQPFHVQIQAFLRPGLELDDPGP
jgi:DNA-binding transcriptional ArsR family regulator